MTVGFSVHLTEDLATEMFGPFGRGGKEGPICCDMSFLSSNPQGLSLRPWVIKQHVSSKQGQEIQPFDWSWQTSTLCVWSFSYKN